MSESSLTLGAKFKAIMLSTILVIFLTYLTGSLVLFLIILWGVCGVVIGAMMCNLVWRLHVSILATQYDAGDFEADRLLNDPALSSLTHQTTDLEHFTDSFACALKDAPVYCTPLEMINKMSSETDAPDGQSVHVQTTFATLVQGFEDNYTFATSPFTSPSMHPVEIFVSKETVVYEDVMVFISSGTPSPLILNHGLPDVTTPGLAKLKKQCEVAIMESGMREMELL